MIQTILSILFFALILFAIFVIAIVILAKRTEAFDLSEEAEAIMSETLNNQTTKNK